MVLKWVEEAVQASKVHLLSTDHVQQAVNTWKIPFDPSLKEVTVSLSGPSPVIEIRNPYGKLIKKGFGLNELLNIHNSAKVVNVKEPEAGMWTVKTSSSGRHSVRITGLSTIDFRAGFSRKPTLDFRKTISRPVQGIPTYVLLNTSGISSPARVDRLELLSISGGSLKSITVKHYPDRKPYGIWNISDFVPPDEAFFLKVTGYDKDGYLFQRVSSVSFSSIVPDAPKVTMPTRTPGYYLQPGQILCSVESLLPFTLSFMRNGIALGMDQYLNAVEYNLTWQRSGRDVRLADSARIRTLANLSLELGSVKIGDAGEYRCLASNEGGSAAASVFLIVQEAPKLVVVQSELLVALGDTTVMECRTSGVPPPQVKWFKDLWASDKGTYICEAENQFGKIQSQTTVTVTGLVAPLIGISPSVASVIEGQQLTLPCTLLAGNPIPERRWIKNSAMKGELISTGSAKFSAGADGSLYVVSPGSEESGEYICTATNAAGYAKRKVQLTVYVRPRVFGDQRGLSQDKPVEISVLAGEEVTLPCEAKSLPPPIITWAKDSQLISPFSPRHTFLPSGSMKITETRISDSGMYLCVATNIAGNVTQSVKLSVHVPPKIQHGARHIKVQVGQRVDIPCNAHGSPPPSITWFKSGRPVLIDGAQQPSNPDGTLSIEQAVVSDAGVYTCVATNIAGRDEAELTLHVQVPPVIKDKEHVTNVSVLVNHLASLYCEAEGTPSPVIMWYKDDTQVTESSTVQIVNNGKILKLFKVSAEDAGRYSCKAVNIAGTSQKYFSVDVLVPPIIEGDLATPSNKQVVIGQSLILECKAAGNPPPVLTWLKDGVPVKASDNIRIEAGGKTLEILSALEVDRGQYICVATSVAGEREIKYEVDVLVPPAVEGGDETSYFIVMANNLLELDCQVTGSPPPTIMWLKGGQLIDERDGFKILLNGRKLVVAQAQVSDTGLYQCVATNIAGDNKKEFEVTVHVPPTIKSSDLPEKTVVRNKPVTLQCIANGIPNPSITWLKDEQPVNTAQGNLRVLSGGRILALTSAQMSDMGRYTCVAVNAAGEKQRDIDLRVYVPPNIMGEEQNVSVLISQAVELICRSDAVPPPTLMWLKDGRPLLKKPGLSISGNGSVLKIEDAQVQDTGRYTCEATNVAGKTEKNYNVNIWVPPNIYGSDELVQLTAIEGNLITLLCESSGIPPPNLTWKKKDSLVLADSAGRVRILSGGRRLQISVAEKADAGLYTCMASNVAGIAKKDYNLQVYIRPSIANSGSHSPESIVIRGKSISLECEAQGIPQPTVTWMKDGRPLTKGKGVEILDEGRILQLKNVHVSDTGRYVCVAVNVAGMTDKRFDLSVHGGRMLRLMQTRPEDAGQYTCIVRNAAGEERKMFGLSVLGNPVPKITWHKDGQLLQEDEVHHMMSDGRFLQITNAQVSQTGRYTCLASNTAGDKSKSFSLNVFVSPTIAGVDSEGSPEDVIVILNSPTSLVCEAYSYPPATITWFKDGAPLESNRNIRILPGGRTLQILNAQEDNAGRYSCVATNEAGEMIKHYEVKVYNDHVNIAANGHTLQIKEAQISDTGRYTCVASNLAGEDELDFDVNIQVPPSFQKLWEIGNMLDTGRSGEAKDVIINNPISLHCETNAAPPPTLTWYKDGRPLTSSDRVLILPGGRVLQIPRAKVEDAGRYTCVAVNEAGEDSLQYDVRVLLPPVIKGANGDLPEEVTVLVNKSARVECSSSGSPAPKNSWQKDGQPLLEDEHHKFLSDGRILQILNAQITDIGRYVCVAENIAGSAKKYFNLNIHVPPSVIGPTHEHLSVVVNHFISLTCEVSGFPPPDLSWLKNEQPIKPNTNVLIVPVPPTIEGPEREVIVETVSNPVTLTCDATGIPPPTITWLKNHKPIVPPNMDNAMGTEEIAIVKGSSTSMTCFTDGTPTPSMSWLKDGQPLVLDAHLTIGTQGMVLQLIKAETEDSGKYTCVASNDAGEISKHFVLKVLVPPSISGGPQSLVTLLNKSIVLECSAEGVPTPRMTWRKDGAVLAGSHTRLLSSGSLVIISPSVDDTASYECTVTSDAGEDKRTVHLTVQEPPVIQPQPSELDVILNNPILLPCEAAGTPSPFITWQKEGINVIASVPPAITSHQKEYVVAVDKPVSLLCEAEGFPSPDITWHKDGHALTESIRQRILNSGALQIAFAQPDDAGRYTCMAANAAGSSSVSTTLTVHAHFDSVNGHSELVIEKVSTEDSGTYVCTAENSVGFVKAIGFVYVKEPPVFKGDYPSNWIEPLGGNAILNCEVRGDPAPTIQWSRKGADIETSHRIRQLGNGSLAIYGTVNEDAGDYTCVAANEAGVVERSMSLTLQSPPIITLEPVETVVDAGGRVILDCQAMGEPQPIITWSRQGHPIPLDNRLTMLSNSSLYITAARKEDTSEYECVARNFMGSVLVRVPVIVQVDGKWASWASWSACTVSCGGGARKRTRDCSDPVPQHGGSKCEGSDVQSDFCNSDPCPTHGNWSPWSGWGTCSRTCNGGQMRRYRTCDNPRPSNGGRACGGPDTQIQRCNTDMCPVDGSWGTWHSWSHCSVSCGGGERVRKRLCDNPVPSKSGRSCPGDATQVSRCNTQACPGGPHRARGSVIGNINDVEFGIAFLDATITDSPSTDTRIIQAKITNVPRSLGPAMRKIISILNPIYWTTAKEIGEAVNGFTLTNAVFKRETQVEFATGEVLRMTHVARGLDSDGALLLDVIVNGYILQLQSPAEVSVKDYTEDYIQTGPGQLYAYSTRLFTVDGISVPYTWNHTIFYDQAWGKMPFLVETLHASSVESDYNQLEETLGFKIHASISKGDRSNQCPSGFTLDSVGPFCADEDECAAGNPCSHACHNAIGAYYCSCPKGLTIAADGRTCQDIDECALGGHTCRAGQDCDNTIGSYRCVVHCGAGFRRTSDGLSCQDIDECQNRDTCQHECKNTIGSYQCVCPPGYRLMLNGKTCQDVDECLEQNVRCGPNRMCFNMRGSYQCIDTPCPPNYQRDPVLGFCLKNCPPNDLECTLSPYALEYKLVSLPFGIAANQDLIRLVAYTQDGVMHPRTTFLMVDEEPAVPFALRDENLKGVVYTTRPLREAETYRMKVRALSYSANGTIEYQTTFIVYISVSAYPY
ncbi:hypothetical protein NN561_000975 [Cricetulus griseus]